MKTLQLVSNETTGLIPEIKQLDLSRIKWKLMDAEEGQGWTEDLCNLAETEYKRYLTLVKLYPKAEIVPNKIMDKFWHQHILDTAAYARDCENIFGEFIHHYPYFGMEGKEDKQNLINAFEHTKALYKITFMKDMEEAFASRCKDHACHKESSCACRTAGACKND